jgi:hypothetical protein
MSSQSVIIPAAIVVMCVFAAGCASEGPPANDAISRAHALVDEADKAGAQRYAAADLQRAHDELSSAQRENDQRKYDEARRDAESAGVDADLASARSAAGEAQHAAQQVAQGNETLRQEAQRNASDSTPNTTSNPQ